MKKILFILTLVILAAAATVYWCAPAREVALGWYDELMAKPAPPAAQPEPAEAPAPAPAEAPAPEPAPEPASAPEPAPAPEPEPAPLPALNAEAEALLPKAEDGDAVAQFNLARQYVLGEGMAVNRAEFLRWCRTAAEQGLPEAQYTLGMCYRRGLGVEQNEEEAARLLKLAADAGYTPSN